MQNVLNIYSFINWEKENSKYVFWGGDKVCEIYEENGKVHSLKLFDAAKIKPN